MLSDIEIAKQCKLRDIGEITVERCVHRAVRQV